VVLLVRPSVVMADGRIVTVRRWIKAREANEQMVNLEP
jgi:hypothetical protein